MLSCDDVRARLDEYVDELLDGQELLQVERHLAGCAGCREELRGLRALLAEAAALPEELEPPRELWPGIEARLAPRSGVLSFAPLRRWAFLAPPLAAAAAALLAIGLSLRPGPQPQPAPGPSQTPVVEAGLSAVALGSGASLAQAEDEYRRATQQLLESLRSEQRALPPGTLETVERNLSAIERSLGEIRAALEQDPENAQLARLLNSTQRRKLQMLQSVARLTRT